jgi:acetylornithine deacetylase/succinyl-diaminopimelate desuccinylase-like protein
VIPGRVEVVTDLRSADPSLLAELARQDGAAARAAAAAESVHVTVGTMLDQAPVHFDAGIRAALAAAIQRVGGDGRELSSQAGHDAVHLQSLAPAGMLFVRCADGVSHRPEEAVTPDDAALAAQALLETILILDRARGRVLNNVRKEALS